MVVPLPAAPSACDDSPAQSAGHLESSSLGQKPKPNADAEESAFGKSCHRRRDQGAPSSPAQNPIPLIDLK